MIEARKFGLSIPEQFRPLIERLIVTKQLFDENGNLIEDLGQIHFGEKIKSEFDKITEAIMRLIETLQGLYNMQPPAQGDRSNPTPAPDGRTTPTPGEPVPVFPGDRFQPQGETLGRATVNAIMAGGSAGRTAATVRETQVVYQPLLMVNGFGLSLDETLAAGERRLAQFAIAGNSGGSATGPGLREIFTDIAREVARQEISRG